MSAFAFITPVIMLMGISMSSNKSYEYLPLQSVEQCSSNIDMLAKKNFIYKENAICLETGFPTSDATHHYTEGQRTSVPYWLIAMVNNDYEYLAMNDEKHCETNKKLLTDTRFVGTGWSGEPYAVCLKTGFPEIK